MFRSFLVILFQPFPLLPHQVQACLPQQQLVDYKRILKDHFEESSPFSIYPLLQSSYSNDSRGKHLKRNVAVALTMIIAHISHNHYQLW